MQQATNKFSKHACQHCGAERKLVETVIDDEFCWDERDQQYVPDEFTDCFEHTGVERCAKCKTDWTGS